MRWPAPRPQRYSTNVCTPTRSIVAPSVSGSSFRNEPADDCLDQGENAPRRGCREEGRRPTGAAPIPSTNTVNVPLRPKMPRSFSFGFVDPFKQPAMAILNLCGTPSRYRCARAAAGQGLEINQPPKTIRPGASDDAADTFPAGASSIPLSPSQWQRAEILKGDVGDFHTLPRRQVDRAVAKRSANAAMACKCSASK